MKLLSLSNVGQVMMIQFVRYTGAGAVGTVVHYGVLISLMELNAASAVAASAAGFAAGAMVNYVLNYHCTFHSKRRHQEALPKFLTVALCGLAINIGIVSLLVMQVHVHYLPSQVLATGVVLLVGFLLNRVWTFGKVAALPREAKRQKSAWTRHLP